LKGGDNLSLDSLGERIRFLRTKENLSMAKLGSIIKASSSNISDWENGKTSPSTSAILALSKYFNVSADWLLTGKELDISLPPELLAVMATFAQDEREDLSLFIEFLNYKKEKKRAEERLKEASDMEFSDELLIDEEEVYLPLLGNAAAGKPMFINELLEGYVPVRKSIVQDKSFLIRAQGDSMIEAGINDGDYVIVRHQPTVENGEMALVRIENDATIKYFYVSNGSIVLKSANPKYPPLECSTRNAVIVIGKIIEVIKKEKAEIRMRHLEE
jgi:repressor LexA